jgi:amino acid transporter
MSRKLGTFLGVYTPTVLTILGVIMYLRFGWLVGQLGLGRVLPIVLIANSITIITTLSFSAVATNVHVGAGGAYHIISRSLGIEIGGAIGLPLYLSQAFSVTLYAYGLAESFRFIWPGLPLQPAALAVILAVGALAYVGAEHALKAQIPLLALVGLSLLALGAGVALRSGERAIVLVAPSGDVGFWAGFAVFFPAVTGVMAGLGLSGDLRDPGSSLPRGSLLAVFTGLLIYLVIPVLLVMGASQETLRSDPLVWTRIAVLGPALVLPGLWAAIFSSAVGSILGAPRTLQALARDGLAPRFLARFRERRDDLLPALLVSLALALGAVYLGNLNAVAAVVTMFFLTVYGTVNVVAAFEALSGDPSWRPRLRVPWVVNLIGGLGCFAVMMLINPLAGLVAIAAELVLWLVISRREHRARWGDARHGLYESLIRWALIKLAAHPVAPRNWRPHVLVFVEDIRHELDLVRFGDWFSQGRGIVTVCKLEVGDLLQEDRPDLAAEREDLHAILQAEGLVVFPEVDMARDLVDGIVDVAQANGMAGIASNTVLLGWPDDPDLQVSFLRAMRRLEAINKSLIFGRIKPRLAYKRSGVEHTVDVWWGGLQRNGDLLLLLAYLLTRNPLWRRTRVRILSVASTETMKSHTEMLLARLLPQIRVEAEVRVLVKDTEETIATVIQRESADAEVVLMGLATPPRGEEAVYAERLETLVGDLPLVFFVKNASLFTGELITPEEEETSEEQQAESKA